MLCKLLLSCALLLAALEPLLGHPIAHSADIMSYAGPVSIEEDQLVSPEELSYSDQLYLSNGYPALLTGDINREGLKTASFIPSQSVKDVMLEKPLLNPLSHVLGGRKQYRKRGSNTECFWKYCV
ncbi:prepro-urotensin II-beta [Colossoma macropomum]|uniref:prepro-urotensin II-beta n=1 Tax=Colossoma macropomum TaxID=42526 RepID=UPI001864EBFD|nr:prepro-urotensin II-beta [Colossoma macropomum]